MEKTSEKFLALMLLVATLSAVPLVSWMQPLANNTQTSNSTYDFQASVDWGNNTNGTQPACFLNASNTIINGTYHPKLLFPGESCTNNESCLSGRCSYGVCSENTYGCQAKCWKNDTTKVCEGTYDIDHYNEPGYCGDSDFLGGCTGTTTCDPSEMVSCSPACMIVQSGGTCTSGIQCLNVHCNNSVMKCGYQYLQNYSGCFIQDCSVDIGCSWYQTSCVPPNWNLSWCNATAGKPPFIANQWQNIQWTFEDNSSSAGTSPLWSFLWKRVLPHPLPAHMIQALDLLTTAPSIRR